MLETCLGLDSGSNMNRKQSMLDRPECDASTDTTKRFLLPTGLPRPTSPDVCCFQTTNLKHDSFLTKYVLAVIPRKETSLLEKILYWNVRGNWWACSRKGLPLKMENGGLLASPDWKEISSGLLQRSETWKGASTNSWLSMHTCTRSASVVLPGRAYEHFNFFCKTTNRPRGLRSFTARFFNAPIRGILFRGYVARGRVHHDFLLGFMCYHQPWLMISKVHSRWSYFDTSSRPHRFCKKVFEDFVLPWFVAFPALRSCNAPRTT